MTNHNIKCIVVLHYQIFFRTKTSSSHHLTRQKPRLHPREKFDSNHIVNKQNLVKKNVLNHDARLPKVNKFPPKVTTQLKNYNDINMRLMTKSHNRACGRDISNVIFENNSCFIYFLRIHTTNRKCFVSQNRETISRSTG